MTIPAAPPVERDWTRKTSILVASLVDTNTLVYHFDSIAGGSFAKSRT